MNLRDILNEDIITLDVQGTTKDEVLRNMAKGLLDQGYINDVDQFVSDIYVSLVISILWVFLCYRHKENIMRLLDGTENKSNY